ncbi:PEP-CTERM sorting domain-containing protein [Sphingomonas sp. ID1715]|uniref:PEPxxWA-CTERM sorting domain-containing protein n=1 Tax=Sphingomonas sp. ID1715 TaxID=1656898 RepID=UPI0014886AF0|nr:PEPxxWA-CTERM sorting domain-containing protein [Sphingomonas sp. ID1715]NNM75818.1 PEP-CTERM sorting domain-containing protein [Sphingomonas sp. ID1715]
MKAILLGAVAALALAGAPASARVLQFTITNVGDVNDKGDFSFQIDEDRVPDIVLPAQVTYGNGTLSPRIAVTYSGVPNVGSGTVNTPITFFTSTQQGGLSFTGPAGVVELKNTVLITNTSFNTSLPRAQNKAIFQLGTFDLSTTPRNSNPVRPFDNYRVTIAAVPEPASWALMIVGFGATGFAARRRGVVKAVMA